MFGSLTWKSPARAPRFRRDFFNLPTARALAHKARPEPSSQPRPLPTGTGGGVGKSLSSQSERDRVVYRRFDAALYAARTRPQWPAGSSIKLPPRRRRERHRGIVLAPTQSELADAPVQR